MSISRRLALLFLIIFAIAGKLSATTVRSSSQGSSASGTAASVGRPTGTTTGDLAICVLSTNGLTSHSDNNGGTPFTKNLNDYMGSDSGTISIWTRRILGGDPATYAWTIGTSQRWTVSCITLQTPNTSLIFDGSISTNADGSSTLTDGTANNIATTQANSIHFAVLTTDGPANTVSSTPAGYTCDQNGGDQWTALCRKVIATAGATGAQSFSWDSLSEYMSASFAIVDSGSTGATINLFGKFRRAVF
jgi:hypothetical protein